MKEKVKEKIEEDFINGIINKGRKSVVKNQTMIGLKANAWMNIKMLFEADDIKVS